MALSVTRLVIRRMARRKLQTESAPGIVQDNDSEGLEQTEIHQVLSNRRRQLTLQCLAQNGGSMEVRELSEEIAAEFSGERPPPRDLRASVYSSLHQTHLPKLDELQVIDYGLDSNSVSLSERFDDVKLYMDTKTPYSITWTDVYFFLGVGSLLILLAAEVGLPVVSGPGSLVWIIIFLALLAGTKVYRLFQMRIIS